MPAFAGISVRGKLPGVKAVEKNTHTCEAQRSMRIQAIEVRSRNNQYLVFLLCSLF
jgi:hypothetical protein